ncbi:helix-turn-helix transcriptional regulator [Streptosporangium lutulentum]|uniref:Transcriptional regulator with XRE-family HTH domain n=1 Tax=Streptosporangium lutulentum TaxID=1461250 RepID=A0ABT9QLV2_9ACTN|nr:helix-turn-helix transcriptional regulator [Streptosporangium lutulentum]MDP9846894.1 transcriptional regulator with XRE-family HTH domain [Streptosporangium lutulentum]
MDSDKLLGEFLRARREVTSPEQVGLVDVGPRRMPGLRREEVAMLAGVSTDYYVRLEQGRERHPSDQVLGSLVRALDLGPAAATHLYELAFPRPRQWRTVGRADRVNPDLRQMMHNWPRTPAIACNRWLDVLAANPLVAALHGGLEYTDNLVRLIFLDPAAHEYYRDWEQISRAQVAYLRAVAGADLNDPNLIELVGELSLKSADFRRIWARHDVGIPCKVRRLRHPEVGDLDLTCEAFSVASAPGQQLLTFQAEPGSPSAHSLALLGSIAAVTDRSPGLVPPVST